MLFSSSTHRFVFISALAIIVCSLPFSVFTTSIGLGVLMVNFLLDGNWKYKFTALKTNKLLWLSLLIYLPVLYSFFYTSNASMGLREIRLWLPFLVVPIVVTMSNPLNQKEFRWVMLLFLLAVLVASFISSVYLFSFSSNQVIDVRQISLFISHIRFSLMVNLAIAIIVNFVVFDNHLKIYSKITLLIVAIWLAAFLFVLQSLTGILMLFLLIAVGLIWFFVKSKGPVSRFVLATIVLSALFIFISAITHRVDRFFTRNVVDFSQLKYATVNGNPYQHDTSRRVYENGNLLYINICYPELKKEWEQRSGFPFDGTDRKGQPLSHTVVRYITSLGYTKDSVGVCMLDQTDISLIENGATSVVFKESRMGIDIRIYQLLWEIDAYRTEGTVSYSSVIQRLVFAKAAWYVIKSNVWFGVGWGDIQESLNQYYSLYEPNLPENLWFMPHNQYLTVWAGAGLVGLTIFVVALLLPFILMKKLKHFLPLYFHLMLVFSMLNEDTFETHIGITFAVIFGSLFIFGFTFSPAANELKSSKS